MRGLWVVLVVLLAVCAGPSAGLTGQETARTPERPVLRLATTTSTYDSGLLDFILPHFEQQFGATVDVIATGTGQALALGSAGDVDVLLVHDRAGEERFMADGNAKARYDVMYNDFIIVGPTEDPAGVAGVDLARDAFARIMAAGVTFISRGDKSGTHSKELSIWAGVPFTPTAQTKWYFSIGQGMGDTLLFANESLGYTLTDRATYLAMREKLPRLRVLVGGESPAENKDAALLNPYSVLAVNPEKHPNVKADLAVKFVEWITSAEAQRMIGTYGAERFGQPLFYPIAR